MKRLITSMLMLLVLGCNEGPDPLEYKPQVTAIFNAPGSRAGNEEDINATKFLVEKIKAARGEIKACLYGFSNRDVYNAVIDAHLRGVKVRIVGDARHFLGGESGYKAIQNAHIPLQVGNQWHIMHNKFFVIDDRFVFVGTGNITTTGFNRNDNNWIYVDSPLVAQDFAAEFEQMFMGRFTAAKERIDNGNTYTVGDTVMEVVFSPQEDAMGRILEELDAAQTDIHFTIFAFTKDQVGSRFIRKHREFQAYNDANGFSNLPVVSLDDDVQQQPRKVVGVMDRSQVYGNFLYHEVYRLAGEGVPMRMDSNENARLTGDYQAGGGRLHSKTMIIDQFSTNPECDTNPRALGCPRVITGSFNWSSAATISNDEVMLILYGKRITNEYYRQFQNMWGRAKRIDQAVCNYLNDYTLTGNIVCAEGVEPGDVIISEVHFDGWNGLTDPTDHTGSRSDLDNDEFIELYNTTNRPIDLSLWTVNNGYDMKVGFTPGTVIQPGQYFLVLDHNLVPYSDTDPQFGTHAFRGGDFVANLPNDPRMPRLNLQNSQVYYELLSSSAEVVDVVGDYGPPFAGGREFLSATESVNYSMERIIRNNSGGDGTDPANWQRARTAGNNVNEAFRDFIIATPGEANSQ